MEETVAVSGISKLLLGKFTGFNRKGKIITIALLIPIALFALVWLLEKAFKIIGWVYNLFWDVIGHYAVRENRRIYTLTIIASITFGLLLENNFNIVENLIPVLEDIWEKVSVWKEQIFEFVGLK